MDPDLVLVIGLALGVLSIPAIVSSVGAGRGARIATVVLMIAGGLVVYAISTKPGGYRVEDLPKVIARVAKEFI